VTDSSSASDAQPASKIDTSVPHSARIWNYWLGGKDITDDGEAQSIVRGLLDSVPSGSYLVLSDGTNVIHGQQGEAAQDDYNESGAEPYALRSPEQLGRFFEGLELVKPGLVSCPRWRPEASSPGLPAEVDAFCAVGRKP
jgi:hypothetical protein